MILYNSFWNAWHPQVITLAEKQKKPVIIHIHFATCHWCHVMQQTTFADAAIMAYMHKHFFCIKIDKEEHPTINLWYAQALKNMGIATGWPLNIFCLPNLLPFLGGTYFSKKKWMYLLKQVLYLYHNKKNTLIQSAKHFAQSSNTTQNISSSSTYLSLHSYIKIIIEQIHPKYGSIAKNVQFPLTSVYNLLIDAYNISHTPTYLQYFKNILQSLSWGGIYDHLAGGFARYALDEKWKIPHFEKMLADNALLLGIYAKAYLITSQKENADIIKKTLQFIFYTFSAPKGGYYNALDADSEGIEGKYYIWTIEEIYNALTLQEAKAIIKHYQITPQGNWQKGYNVLYKTSKAHPTSSVLLAKAKKKLYQIRQKRTVPALEKKIIVAHNAMLLQSLLDSYFAINKKEIWKKALSLATWLLQHIQKKKPMERIMDTNIASPPGTLIDYAWIIQAYISLYQTTLSLAWLDVAKSILEDALIFFYDPRDGFFFESAKTKIPPFLQEKYIEDNIYPNANAIMGYNLYRIGLLYQKKQYITMAKKMYQKIIPNLQKKSFSWISWSKLYLSFQEYIPLFLIIGQNAQKIAQKIHQLYPGEKIVTGKQNNSNKLPIITDKPFTTSSTIIYTCLGKKCLPPTTSLKKILSMLAKQ